MKIELPNDLRTEVKRVRAALLAIHAASRVTPLPSGHLTEAAATLGKVSDFYLAAVERCYAEATEQFYRDWPMAMEAGRRTPAYQYVLGLRIMAHKKRDEQATEGNVSLFIEYFDKALGGCVNLSAPPIVNQPK